MTVEEILTPVIKRELQKYEESGKTLKLKRTGKLKVKATLISLLLAVLSLCLGPIALFAWVVILITYINKMKKIDNVYAILEVAKKNPDTPIDRLVWQEVSQ